MTNSAQWGRVGENKKERLTVSVSSPLFDGANFICAPWLEGGRRRNQVEVATAGVKDIGVTDQVVGCQYNTTASNISPAVGTMTLLEEHQQQQIMKILWRHQIIDLF